MRIILTYNRERKTARIVLRGLNIMSPQKNKGCSQFRTMLRNLCIISSYHRTVTSVRTIEVNLINIGINKYTQNRTPVDSYVTPNRGKELNTYILTPIILYNTMLKNTSYNRK